MIAKVPALGTGFKGLQQYLLHGRAGASPDRSLWVSTRNLVEGDPERIAGIMRHTANTSQRTEKPVFHVALSMAPGERLGRDDLEQIADRLLADLGLAEYQTMIAEHTDGAQQHIHLMVNRVHPETGRAWHPSLEYQKIERSLRAQEQERGLRVVPGRHAPVVGRDMVRGGTLSTRPFAERARDLAGDVFKSSKSWQEVHAGLSREGLSLKPSRSGRGLVVTDGRQYVAASRVDRSASRARLETKLGSYEAPSRDLEQLQDVARDLAKRGRLEALRARYRSSLRDLGEALADHKQAGVELAGADRRLGDALTKIYRDPDLAQSRLVRFADREGIGSAVERLGRSPGKFGKLRGTPLPGNRDRGAARETLRREAPEALRRYVTAQQTERSKIRQLEPFRAKSNQPVLEAAGRARAILGRALGRLERIDQRTAPYEQLGKTAATLVKRLGWKAVARLVPHPAFQMVQVAISIVSTPVRIIERGLDR